MILNALYDCYGLLAKDPNSGIAPEGYSRARCDFAIVLDLSGSVTGILPLQEGKRGQYLIVPEQSGRAAGVKSYFLCDKSKYLFGLEYDNKTKSLLEFPKHVDASEQEHRRILEGKAGDGATATVACEAAEAVLCFFEKVKSGYRPDIPEDHPVYQGGLLVFRLEGIEYIHEDPKIKNLWEDAQFRAGEEDGLLLGQCLITGERNAAIARTHYAIKGVKGAQVAGASLISFNCKAFTSYGKEQSYNAPVSQRAMVSYTSALNYLISQQRNKKILGDTTVVFWTKKAVSGEEVDVVADMFFGGSWEEQVGTGESTDIDDSSKDNAGGKNDSKAKKDEKKEAVERDIPAEKTISDLIERMRSGTVLAGVLGKDIDLDTETYILGLAPNNARLSVRFWYQNSLADFAKQAVLHYQDMEIVKPSKGRKYASIRDILKNMSALGDLKNLPSSLVRSLFDAILTGGLYPRACFQGMLMRIRCEAEDDFAINFVRVGFMKAYLLRYYRAAGRKEKEEEITVNLNEESTSVGYQLGRLFTILEDLQYRANDGNTTIRARYFSSAMATPSVAFVSLIKLAQAHINKTGYTVYWDQKMSPIIDRVGSPFPATLSTEEQGMFILGFYQQKQALFEEREQKRIEAANKKSEVDVIEEEN